jgi:hypothetical protein
VRLTDTARLDCGCVFGHSGDAFVVVPCTPTCPRYRYVLEESARRHKPMFALPAPGTTPADMTAYGF